MSGSKILLTITQKSRMILQNIWRNLLGNILINDSSSNISWLCFGLKEFPKIVRPLFTAASIKGLNCRDRHVMTSDSFHAITLLANHTQTLNSIASDSLRLCQNHSDSFFGAINVWRQSDWQVSEYLVYTHTPSLYHDDSSVLCQLTH